MVTNVDQLQGFQAIQWIIQMVQEVHVFKQSSVALTRRSDNALSWYCVCGDSDRPDGRGS